MVQMGVNVQITWWNQCVKHVIRVEEDWEIGVDNTGIPIRYYRDDSVVVFRYFQQKYPTLRSRWFIILLLSIFPPHLALCWYSSSVGGLCWAGNLRTACMWKLLTVTSTHWFCRRIPAFAESGIEPVSSVLGNFVDNTGIPLRYHRDDSVVVFRYFQKLGLGSKRDSRTKDSGCSCNKRI